MRDHLKNAWKRIRNNKEFAFVLMLFFPDYLFYPCLFVSICILLKRLIAKEIKISSASSWTFFVFALLIFCVSTFYNNVFGMIGSVFVIYLILYGINMSAMMTPARYMKLQLLIATASIYSFIANCYDFRIPYISSYIQSLFSSYTGTYFVPEFTGFNTRIFSTFDNPNYYAFILMIVILVCFNQIQFQITFKNYRLACYYGFVLALNCIALNYTGTRTVIPALVIGMITIMVIQKKYNQIKVLGLIALGYLALILIRPDIAPRFHSIFNDFDTRLDIWRNAISFIKQAPWFGKGMFTYFYNAQLNGIDFEMHSHSLYLEPLLSFGLIGSLLLGGALVLDTLKFKKYASYLDTPLAASVIIATAAYGVFDIPIIGIQTSILFVAVMSLPLRKRDSVIT